MELTPEEKADLVKRVLETQAMIEKNRKNIDFSSTNGK